MHFIRQLIHFGIQQALSRIFAVLIFATLAISKVVKIPGVYRYDFILTFVCSSVSMMYTKLETWDQFKVICLFPQRLFLS